ncbi:MAG TPA: DNA (cytosine-5-)-methyltransferase [Anaerovoracaceae bacterium]|nr:DNA (cytosine-5-)-methyltransferase [Anaerovoracaceae bacterium]
MKDIVLLDLFSGAGGFAKGLEEAGFKIKKHYFSEIDKHAIANYKYNFKNAEYVGSVTDVRGSGIDRPDIITFGSPCQDFSLAGKRSGMEGQRSVLILEAIRIITECKPGAFIWENVKGTFSSNNGADFWAIIAAFANIGGYRLEWQLLNTSWFLPQNRERIYLVGHLAGRSEPGVFPIRENISRVNEGTAEASIVRNLTAGGHSGGLHSSTALIRHRSNKDYRPEALAPTLRNGDKGEVRIVVNTNTSQGYEIETEGDSINFSNPNSKTRRGRVGKGKGKGKGKAQTLDTQCNQGVIQINPSLESVGNKDTISTKPRGFNRGNESEICGTITRNSFEHNNYVNNIRRLTEIECERLQGFPDNWTEYGDYDGVIKKIPKTQRYKLMGNAVTVKVVKAVAERLKLI